MTRQLQTFALATLALTSFALAADPEDLGARPHVAPPRQSLDQDDPPISRDDSFLRRGDLRILDPGPDLLDGPPRSRQGWQQLVERDLDRVMGRIEPQDVFELRQLERDRARRSDVFDRPREFDRFQEERDRNLRLEQQGREQAGAVQRERLLERESERLRAERERFQRAMNANTTSGAVAADTRMLQQRGAAHQVELSRIEAARTMALREIDARPNLSPAQRSAERAASERHFAETRAQRIEAYEQRRATILGNREKGGR